MVTSKVCSIEIPSCIDCIGFTVEKIMKFAEEAYGSLSECSFFKLKVVLNELLLNAIKHGSQCDEKKHVYVTAGIHSKKGFFLLIEDEGSGFDSKNVQNICCIPKENEIQNLKETGRGIFIVKSLCKEVKFNHKGNKVLVVMELNES